MSSNRTRRGHGLHRGGRRNGASDLETTFFGETNDGRRRGQDTKTLQMCRQVRRRLDMALGGELSNPALQGLWVNAVLPEPGGSAVIVEVIVDDPTRLGDVMRELEAARGFLRAEVAQAIHRKRTPYLQFVVLPATVLHEEDDDDVF